MKSQLFPSEHVQAFMRIGPYLLFVAVPAAFASYYFLQPPVWALAIATATGGIYAVLLLPYWRNPAQWKFGLMIGGLVGVQNGVCNRLWPRDPSLISGDFWIPILFFLSVFYIGLFSILFLHRKALRNLIKPNAAEPGAAANP